MNLRAEKSFETVAEGSEKPLLVEDGARENDKPSGKKELVKTQEVVDLEQDEGRIWFSDHGWMDEKEWLAKVQQLRKKYIQIFAQSCDFVKKSGFHRNDLYTQLRTICIAAQYYPEDEFYEFHKNVAKKQFKRVIKACSDIRDERIRDLEGMANLKKHSREIYDTYEREKVRPVIRRCDSANRAAEAQEKIAKELYQLRQKYRDREG